MYGYNPKSNQVNALQGILVTVILPIRPDLAMMVTNSIGGMRCDVWMIFERHMRQDGDIVRTILRYVGNEIHDGDAIRKACEYAKFFYGVVIDTSGSTL